MTGILEKLFIANEARNKLWDPKNQFTPLFFATELAGEIGELCNVVKKHERARLGLPGSQSSAFAFQEELADSFIVLVLLAQSYGITKEDIQEIIAVKFNQTSAKHGFPVMIP